MDAYRAQRNRQDEQQQQRRQAELEQERVGKAWNRVTGNCEFLAGQGERSECIRDTRNSRTHQRHFTEMEEADRQTRLAAASAAAKVNAIAEERKRAAAR